MVIKSDVETELRLVFDSGITSDYISSLSSLGEAYIRKMTGCTTFTGDSAIIFDRAVLCYVVTRLVTSDPQLLKASISEVSEAGVTIKFANGRGISTYETEMKQLIESLEVVSSSYGGFSYTNEVTFYNPYST